MLGGGPTLLILVEQTLPPPSSYAAILGLFVTPYNILFFTRKNFIEKIQQKAQYNIVITVVLDMGYT